MPCLSRVQSLLRLRGCAAEWRVGLGEVLGPRPPSRTHGGHLGDGQLADLQAEGHRARAAGGGLQEACAGGQPGRDAAVVSGGWDQWGPETWGSYGPLRGQVSGAQRKLHLLVPNLQQASLCVLTWRSFATPAGLLSALIHPTLWLCPSPHPSTSSLPRLVPTHTDRDTHTTLTQTSPLVQARVLGEWPFPTFLSFRLAPHPHPRHPVSPLPQVPEKQQPRGRGEWEASPAERNHTGGHG